MKRLLILIVFIMALSLAFAHAEKATDPDLVSKTLQALENTSIGNIITFGTYEQDNDQTSTDEPIEWIVLSKENAGLLVVSRYALDCQPYHLTAKNVTWETCTLRSWLNQDFINVAFSPLERRFIPAVRVSADMNPDFATDPGAVTEDQVFLLSNKEAARYLTSADILQCKATSYAMSQGAFVNTIGLSTYWLRSPGFFPDWAATVIDNTLKQPFANAPVTQTDCAVRPAMWISLDAIRAYVAAHATPTPSPTPTPTPDRKSVV